MRMESTALGLLIGAGLVASTAAAQRDAGRLEPIIVDVQVVADSGSYFTYGYIVRNPANSSWAVARLRMDLTAPRGTGTKTLPATGRFRHPVAMGDDARVIDHVPAGPMSPPNWQAWLFSSPIVGSAILQWHGTRGGLHDLDSIAPGASLSGFGIRTPYLPGFRPVWAEPTWQSCCAQPRPPQPDVDPGEHPGPAEFRVTTLTVGPTLHPDSVSIYVLQAFQARSCADLQWITDTGLCASLGARLGRARQSLTRADRTGARAELRSFLSELEARHGAGLPVSDNAYWLLKVNAESLLGRLE